MPQGPLARARDCRGQEDGGGAADLTKPFFSFEEDPHNPGWLRVAPGFAEGFFPLYGPLSIRAESDTRARVRTKLLKRHLNALGKAHGGYLLALVDQVLFLGPAALGIEGALGGVTVDATSHFMTPVTPDRPVDLVVDILRDTRRMIFVRGLIEQEGDAAAAFSGVVRKAAR